MCGHVVNGLFPLDSPEQSGAGGGSIEEGTNLRASEAANLQDTDPERLEQEMRVFKMAWESKRQTAYARWVRAEWSIIQWWWNRRRRMPRGIGPKAEDSTGIEGETGNWLTLGGGNDPGG